MADQIRIELADRAARSRDKKNAAISWARSVDARLDQLKQVAEDAGERTTRAELAAALVATATTEASRLRELLTAFRVMSNRDVLLDAADDAEVVRLPVHRPGPRSRSM